VIRKIDIAELRKIFPRPYFEIVEIRELGEPAFIAIRTEIELEEMRKNRVKFEVMEG